MYICMWTVLRKQRHLIIFHRLKKFEITKKSDKKWQREKNDL